MVQIREQNRVQIRADAHLPALAVSRHHLHRTVIPHVGARVEGVLRELLRRGSPSPGVPRAP